MELRPQAANQIASVKPLLKQTGNWFVPVIVIVIFFKFVEFIYIYIYILII